MGCNCNKRGNLIRAAVKAVVNHKPVAPIVRGLGRTVATDIRSMARVMAPKNPRFR